MFPRFLPAPAPAPPNPGAESTPAGPRLEVQLEKQIKTKVIKRIKTKEGKPDKAIWDVGCANSSHPARFFRRETGLSPGDYHQQR